MFRIRFLLPTALLVLGACTDSPTPPTPPQPELTVQLTATASAPHMSYDRDGGPTISCEIGFAALASGDPDARADWTGGIIRYYLGADPQPVDSLTLAEDEMREAFGNRFGPGETREAGLRIVAGIPFSLEIQLRYRVIGAQAERSVTARASCGVPAGAPSGPAPTVSGVTVAGPAEPEPGDTVRVTWTATASPALWETGIEVAGAFTAVHRVAGDGRASVTHTVALEVPDSARLGEPFQVRAYAVDPWARGAASFPWVSAPVVDRTPPEVVSVRTRPPGLDGWTPALVGQYGARDTMTLYVLGDDNHGLAWAVYEFGPQGVRDSVAFGLGGYAAFIPVRPEMVGATGFRVHFRDASGNRTPDFVAEPGAVGVYPVRNAPLRSLQVPERPEAVVVDPVRNRLYAVLVNRQELRVHSLATLALERTVPLPFSATDLELTADADSLLVSSRYFGRVLVMDVNATVAPPTLALQGPVYGIRIASTGRAVALVGTAGERQAVVEVDLGTGAQRVVVPDLAVPHEAAGVARSRDRRKMMLGGGCLFDVATEQVGACRNLAEVALGPVAGDATGARWGHLYTVYDAALQPVVRVDNAREELLAGIVPVAGGEAYVAHRRGLVRVRADGSIAERLAGPTLAYLHLSDDGGVLAAWGFAPTADGPYHIHVLDPR